MYRRFSMIIALSLAVCCSVSAEDLDVAELRAKLAAQETRIAEQDARMADQESRMNDLQAKFNTSKESSGTAANVTSLRKNATVTIGGTVDTRYYYFDADVKTSRQANAGTGGVPVWGASPGGRVKREDIKAGDFTIYNAKVMMRIEVNDHFDAYMRMSLHDGYSRRNVSGIAQNYWIRWKNICNAGFGLLIGRDGIKFGDDETTGVIMNYAGGQEGLGEVTWQSQLIAASGSGLATNGQAWGDGMFAGGSLVPYHTGFDFGRTTQINPYWENRDGTFRIDASLLQSRERLGGGSYSYQDGDAVQYRSINYGLGSGTLRMIWRPVEGLKLTASALNFYTNSDRNHGVFGFKGNSASGGGWTQYGNNIRTTSNNSAINLAFQYRPCFLNRMKVWGQWVHGWNEAWIQDMDSDSLNTGISFDFTDRLTAFVQGDFLRVKNRQSDEWNKGKAWAFYTGLKYALPYGVNLEAGWKHERIAYYERGGNKHTTITGNTIYGHLGFNF